MQTIVRYSRGFLKKLKEDHVSAYAAQAAFFVMLSFIPFVLLLLTLIQYTEVTKSDLYFVAQDLLPTTLDRFVIGIIDEMYERGAFALSLSAVTAVWSAGKAFFALMHGMNVIYGVEEPRGYVRLRLRAAGYTLIFLVAIVLCLVLLVFGNSLHEMALKHMPILAVVTGTVLGLKNMISLAVLTFFFVILYRFVPNHKAKLHSLVTGAVFASVGWFLFSTFFSIYIDISNGFSNMYGSLTTVILVMLWLYFCMYILLIGAEINVYFEEFRQAGEIEIP